MAWYVAHALMVLRPQSPITGPIFCWENLLLIECQHDEDPWAIAERRAGQDADEEYRIQPPYIVPSRWEFGGIRRVVEVRCDTKSDELASGDELTYNTLLFEDEATIEKFVANEECVVRYSS